MKVGWKVEHCLDKELHKLMGFLLPIFFPIKPHRIIKSFATALLAAWKEKRKVNCSAHFAKNLAKMVNSLHPEKHTYLFPFVVHGYWKKGLLTPDEETLYDQAEALWKFPVMKVEEEEEGEVKLSDSDSTEVTKVIQPAAAPPSTWSRRGTLGSQSASRSKTVSKTSFPVLKTSISGNQMFQTGFATATSGLREMLDAHQQVEEIIVKLCHVAKCKETDLIVIVTALVHQKELQRELNVLR
jgi:hypothetical protein